MEITSITDTAITFEWAPPTGITVDATKIRLKNNDNKIITSYDDQPSPISEFSITGLKPGTPYIVMIQSKSGEQLSTVVTKGLRTGQFISCYIIECSCYSNSVKNLIVLIHLQYNQKTT